MTEMTATIGGVILAPGAEWRVTEHLGGEGTFDITLPGHYEHLLGQTIEVTEGSKTLWTGRVEAYSVENRPGSVVTSLRGSSGFEAASLDAYQRDINEAIIAETVRELTGG